MPLSIPLYSNGDTITAESLLETVTLAEAFLNGGIDADDLKDDAPWITAPLLAPAEFFAGPHPRVVLPTAETVYRRVDNRETEAFLLNEDASTDWVPVHEASAPVVIDPPRDGARANVVVKCTFYTYESGGEKASADSESAQAGVLMLFVDGNSMDETGRSVYASTTEDWLFGRKHHVIYWTLSDGLERGEHAIELRCRVSASSGRDWMHVRVKARSFVVSVDYA